MVNKALRIIFAVLALVGASFAVSVSISAPTNGSTVTSPVSIKATASSSYSIIAMHIYVDGVNTWSNSNSTSLSTSLALTSGAHQLTVKAWDANGYSSSSSTNVTVGTTTSSTVTVKVNSPTSSTVTSPVTISASASSSLAITGWQIYVDSVSAYSGGATSSISAPVTMTSGTHQVVVRAWNSAGSFGSANLTLTASSTQTTSPVAVSISPSTAVLQVGSTQQFSASVTGSTNTGVTWLVNGVQGGNSTVGTISSTGLYTTPSTAPSGGTVTISARSMADTTKSANASVSIASAATKLSISVSPTSASVAAAGTKQFVASVTGTTNTGVAWLVNGVQGGSSSVGTIASDGTYSAPACPSASNVTVTARSTYDSSMTANAAVTVSGTSTASGNYYVSPNGNDSNDGSACHPWATIMRADSSAKAGSVVHVAPGTYNVGGAIATRATGTSSARVKYISDTKWGAKLVVTGINGWSINGAYEDIVGFDITCGSTNACNQLFKGQAASARVIGNRIHDQAWTSCAKGAGIMFGTGSDGSQASDNYIFNIGLDPSAGCNQMHGIYISTSNDTLSNNLIVHCGDNGIQLYSGTTSNTKIMNNTIVNCKNGLELNNDYPSTGLYVANNILVNNSGYGIYNCQSGNTITKNLLYKNGTATISCSSTVSNTISSDPQFVNNTGTSSGNYQVNSSSPVIKAGTTTNAPTTDMNGAPRSGGVDLGSYQYGASTTVAWPMVY